MKNKTLFVTATNTDVGKTYACEKLLKYYARKDLKVGYFKPCETGVNQYPLDGTKMLNLVKELNPKFKADINDVVPYQFKLPAAPYVAKGKSKIDIKLLIEKKNYLKSMCNVLIIEGAGGLMVPIEEDIYIIDLIKVFEAKAVLISPSKLGCINDTLLSIEALEKRDIKFKWYINLYENKKSFEKVSKPFFKNKFGKLKYLNDLD